MNCEGNVTTDSKKLTFCYFKTKFLRRRSVIGWIWVTHKNNIWGNSIYLFAVYYKLAETTYWAWFFDILQRMSWKLVLICLQHILSLLKRSTELVSSIYHNECHGKPILTFSKLAMFAKTPLVASMSLGEYLWISDSVFPRMGIADFSTRNWECWCSKLVKDKHV